MIEKLNKSISTPEASRLYAEGCRLQSAGRLKQAVLYMSRAIECDGRFARAYFKRGACHYMLGNYRLARNDLDAASVLGCGDAQLWSRFDSRSNDCRENGP